MMGTKRLREVAETGVEAVKKADNSLRLLISLAAACLIVGLCTLAAVLASRPARA